MKKAVALALCAALFLCLAGNFSVFADAASYYATITDFTAVYDKYMQKVELEVQTRGFIADAENFTVEIYCSVLDPYYNQWFHNQTIGLYSLNYGNCLKGGNKLVAALPLEYDRFDNPSYKDFRVRVNGNPIGDGTFYTMDSADIPISPKAEAAGTPVGFTAKATPSSTAVGGYSVLKLEIKDIEKELSGGLTHLSFTLNYNPAVVRLDGVEASAAASGWAPVASAESGKVTLSFMGGGITEDGDLTVRFKFMAVGAGNAGLSVTELSGGDGYGHGFNGAAASLDKDITVTEAALLGDVNGDGKVNSLDAAYVLRYDAGIITAVKNGDVNGDGRTNSLDAAYILKLDAGIIDSFN